MVLGLLEPMRHNSDDLPGGLETIPETLPITDTNAPVLASRIVRTMAALSASPLVEGLGDFPSHPRDGVDSAHLPASDALSGFKSLELTNSSVVDGQ